MERTRRLACLTMTALWLTVACSKPPYDQLEAAEQTVREAQSAGAPEPKITVADGTLTVTISGTTDDKTFTWASNIGVDGVFVKAGSGGSYLYRYDEATGDTSLTSPGSGTTKPFADPTSSPTRSISPR